MTKGYSNLQMVNGGDYPLNLYESFLSDSIVDRNEKIIIDHKKMIEDVMKEEGMWHMIPYLVFRNPHESPNCPITCSVVPDFSRYQVLQL